MYPKSVLILKTHVVISWISKHALVGSNDKRLLSGDAGDVDHGKPV